MIPTRTMSMASLISSYSRARYGQSSMGSCNMDKLSLYHNFEQNIESKDLSFILDAKKEIFQAALQYSKPYKLPTGADKIKTILWGLATDPFDPLD